MMPQRAQTESHTQKIEHAEQQQRVVHGMQEETGIFMRHGGVAMKKPIMQAMMM